MNYSIRRWILVLLLTVGSSASDFIIAQGTPDEFPAGIFVYTTDTATAMYNAFNAMGMNYIGAEFNNLSQNSPANLMGSKDHVPDAYITKYTRGGYYTRWEAEGNTFNLGVTGVKHKHNGSSYILGQPEEYPGSGSMCWASHSNISQHIPKFQFGPNYKQDKKYYWYLDNQRPIDYVVNFRMGLTGAAGLDPNTVVCTLRVMYTWAYKINNSIYYDSVQLGSPREVKLSEFSPNSLDTFLISYNYNGQLWKSFDGSFPDSISPTPVKFDDVDSTGIEFIIDYNGVGKLYVDYVEVYDNRIGIDFLRRPSYVDSVVKFYCNSNNTPNLRYWLAYEEPYTIDSYTPYKIIDSIVKGYTGKNIITMLYTHWTGYLNGDDHMKKFIELANPQPLMIDWFPFWPGVPAEKGFDFLSPILQRAHEAQAGFWYVPQAFGIRETSWSGPFCHWRKPSPQELNASVMLALSYGCRGLMFWMFASQPAPYKDYTCQDTVNQFFDAIVDPSANPTELYHYLKNDLVARLKGKLGNTLLNQRYTGNYLNYKYLETPHDNSAVTRNYLTLGYSWQSTDSTYWHAGFFNKSTDPENNYFLLANVLSNLDRNVSVRVTAPVSGYRNYNFRDIEGSFDTTFTSEFITNLSHSAGEGKLYQVAPVIKYGGNLVYNDTVKSSGTELIDNMSINNGVTLSIKKNVTYIVSDTISLEGSGFISGQGYLDLSEGTINTVSWSKSLFKGVNGNHPRLYIRGPLTESTPTSYQIYRKQGTGFILLDYLDGSETEYTDSTIDISPLNHPVIEYYLKAVSGALSVNTNIVRYDKTDSAIQVESLILPGGWQTVSVPVIMTESSVDTILGTNDVYKFSGSYQEVSTLENGVGYWANFFTGPDTIVFNGTPVVTLAMPVVSGWNLKGSLFYNIFVSQVHAEPDTIIESIFKYVTGEGYTELTPDSLIKPGIGYWIKTNDSGTVYMEENLGKITSLPDINFALMDKFIIQDAGGNKQTLYVTNTDLDTISINADFEMPPYYSELPFDSRFGLSDLVKKVSAAAGPVDLDILVQALSYPVTLSWELNPANCINYSFIGDSILGKVSGLGKAVFTSLDSGKIKLTAFADKEGYKALIPKEFELLQNYPNPFNPHTRIKYSVAEERRVSLIVYNILGQQVAVLKDEIQRPGYYELNFDASSLSSGVYLYTLQAGDYINTKKLIVLK